MNTIEIFRTAKVVIEQQGRSAAGHYARERHRLSAMRSDVASAQVWERVETAIRHILAVGDESTIN